MTRRVDPTALGAGPRDHELPREQRPALLDAGVPADQRGEIAPAPGRAVAGRRAETAEPPAACDVAEPEPRLTRNGEDERPARDTGELGQRRIGIVEVLEDLGA